jgi:hypothetical protein
MHRYAESDAYVVSTIVFSKLHEYYCQEGDKL